MVIAEFGLVFLITLAVLEVLFWVIGINWMKKIWEKVKD